MHIDSYGVVFTGRNPYNKHMRICSTCGTEKPSEEYYPGRGSCRVCVRERMRVYASRPEVRERNRIANQTPRQKENRKRYKKLHRKNKPEEKYAHERVRVAIRDGRLTRSGCEICGEKGEAHHPDYSKPLEVRWLCRTHHKRLHAEKAPKPKNLCEHGQRKGECLFPKCAFSRYK